MKKTNEVVACVVDHGLFVHIAQCLGEQMKRVYYCGPPERVMPKLCDAIVGDGFGNIERVTSLWDVKDECDLFVFPDIGFAGEQKELISQGFPVWGHHGADVLEKNIGKFLSTLKDLEMEIAPYVTIKGMTALKEHLKDIEDVYVKVSRHRGDWETLHFRNWELDKSTLDCHAYHLGPAKELVTFYVFDAIDTPIEDGVDAWCIDGEWPETILHAMERKDKSLIGAMQKFSDVAEPVREVNERFGPVLAKYGYRGAFSTEVRLNEKAYFIDPTCRFGSPPSQLQTFLIKNLPEVIWSGANGEMIEPEYDDPIGAQVLVTTDRDKEEWLTFDMPDELRPHIKSAFACEIDGIVRIAPNPLENWAGWLVATGDSVESVVDELKRLKALLPDGFECDLSSLADLIRELQEAKDEGVTVTTQPMPDPAIILNK